MGERSFVLFKDYLSGRQLRVKIGDTFFQLERSYKRGFARKCPESGVSVFQYFHQRLVLLY